MPEPLLVCDTVSKTFTYPVPLQLFSDISLELFPQESVAIIGRSGEGKTTLLHILGTLDFPTSGTITLFGKDSKKQDANYIRNHNIGFVFQSFHLFYDSTVLENILIPVKIARLATHKNSYHYKRALQLIDRVGLNSRIDFPCRKLSGGEKQRTALARALIMDPEILLADEPTGNLDHATAQEIQSLLFFCVKEEKKSLILVTHNQSFATSCDRSFVLDNGVLKKNEIHMTPKPS